MAFDNSSCRRLTGNLIMTFIFCNQSLNELVIHVLKEGKEGDSKD
jgi:hypothetical protein